MQRHQVKPRDDDALLTQAVTFLATKYGRYGYRRITALLRQDGWRVNHKRVECIWRREGLKVPQKQPKRARLWFNDGSCIRKRPEYKNHVWSVDFIFDLGESQNIAGFKYLPDQQRFDPGIIFNYKLYLSIDGKNWKQPVAKGEFSNIRNSPVWQTESFAPVNARYIKFTALSPAEENGKVGIAEFDIVTQ